MNKSHLLQKLAPLPFAAFGVIVFTGITTAPAQAFTLDSTLEWDDATSDFWDDVNLDDVGDIFSVTFSPADLGGEAASFINTGDFAPFFTDPDNLYPINNGAGATGTFQNLGPGAIGSLPALPASESYLELTNDLVFNFGNGVTATLPDGSIFVGLQEPDTSFEFDLEGGAVIDGVLSEWIFNIDGDTRIARFSNFEFGDLPPEDGGNFAAEGFIEGETRVPEPASIIGFLTIGGLGLGLKRKKQSIVES